MGNHRPVWPYANNRYIIKTFMKDALFTSPFCWLTLYQCRMLSLFLAEAEG